VGERDSARLRITWADRFWLSVAPGYGQRRIEARARVQMMSRHFEAAQGGRRTDGWRRVSTDVNTANAPALAALRELARDLRRNNGWARRGVQAITNNTVGWGIMPKAKPGRSEGRARAAIELWNDWATTTECDHDGLLNFYGIQRLAMDTLVEAGEVLIVKQPATSSDGLSIPMRVQILEPDYIDISRTGVTFDGNKIFDGVEFDKRGRRVAYWLFTAHPGGQRVMTTRFESVRTPADRVIHVFHVDRPGQIRGVSWLAAAIAKLKDYDDYEDAELIQQKIAACFGAFVKNMDGGGPTMGADGVDSKGKRIESLEPGQIEYLRPGEEVEFATPPVPGNGSLSQRTLRRVAVTLGITYEELTGDYSQVNFSSARMARLAEWQNVYSWREHMLIPMLCDRVWSWAMELTAGLENWPEVPGATWSASPMPILEPDKEGLAYQRMIRNGLMTLPQAIRELGYDPFEQIAEIEAFNKELDDRGIVLDSDPRYMTVAGQVQQVKQLGAGDAATAGDPDGDGEDDAADGADAEGDAADDTSAATH
jgi:lambda family phage portal protein